MHVQLSSDKTLCVIVSSDDTLSYGVTLHQITVHKLGVIYI